MTTMSAVEIEALIVQFFEENFELLRLESGRSLAPEVKTAARWQAILYWRKLADVATKITDTEVKLNLPGQETPKGRKFGIEGVVDIVREDGRTTMYDIKTHDLETVRGNLPLYEEQLNVYAHIWKHLRGQELDDTAIISTSFPDEIREAILSDNAERLAGAIERWDPVVPIPFDEDRLAETIRHFGEIVDAIEDGEFEPVSVERLRSPAPGMRTSFAVNTCRNCDARFSCDSYRAYAQRGRAVAERGFAAYLAEPSSDIELAERLIAGLDAAPPPATLE